MDREELVESSSSQNVNISIASLQKRGAGKETVRVSLSEGSSFFMPQPLEPSWIPGKVLSEEDLELLRSEDSYIRGKEWAASRLAVREDSSGRMMLKLQQRGYSTPVCRRILDNMESLGFLDDHRFSELWISLRLQTHPEGRDALVAGLQKRGVPGNIARAQVQNLVSDQDEAAALHRAAEKLRHLTSDKLFKKLLVRGFSYSSIKKELARDREPSL